MVIPFQLNRTEETIPYILFYDKGKTFVPEHWHNEIEIVYALRGGVCVVINGTEYKLKEKEIVFLLPGDTHSYLNTHDHERMVILFSLALFAFPDAPNTKPTMIINRLKAVSRWSGHWTEEHREAAREILDRLAKINTPVRLERDLEIRARLTDLILLICEEDASVEPILSDNVAEKAMRNMATLFSYIESNYASYISLEAASQIMWFAPGYFTRYFKKYTGVTFMEYLTNFRISKAKEMLIDTVKPVIQIAEETGFSSIKTFNRRFKDQVGVSPSEYRKSMNEKNKS
ncbi:MAG: AraC family transcriptional regulator [Clostridiales Family XIII bacterium]|nr:AraC family transcriptional regulator [Clostridiales Family XIII bacterium]